MKLWTTYRLPFGIHAVKKFDKRIRSKYSRMVVRNPSTINWTLLMQNKRKSKAAALTFSCRMVTVWPGIDRAGWTATYPVKHITSVRILPWTLAFFKIAVAWYKNKLYLRAWSIANSHNTDLSLSRLDRETPSVHFSIPWVMSQTLKYTKVGLVLRKQLTNLLLSYLLLAVTADSYAHPVM